LTEIFWLSK